MRPLRLGRPIVSERIDLDTLRKRVERRYIKGERIDLGTVGELYALIDAVKAARAARNDPADTEARHWLTAALARFGDNT
jgi:hypothetical protein